MTVFVYVAIVGLIIVSIVGLIIDNRLDKKHGVSYDHHGNEIAHNTSGALVFVWCLLCAFAAFILNDLDLMN